MFKKYAKLIFVGLFGRSIGGMADVLVIYYSRKGENYMPGGLQHLDKGHTERAAEYISKAIDADIFKIDTVKPYSDTYYGCCREAEQETWNNTRPEIKGFINDISAYKTIFVCFPCWCGTAPMCIFTFLDNYDLSGKKLIPFCTHEGSGMANAEKDLKNNYPNALVVPGLAIRGHKVIDSEDKISGWAKQQV